MYAQLTQLVFFLLTIVLVAALAIPSLCLVSSIISFLPGLGSLPLFILGVILVWLLLPLAFSPHGIFISQQSAWVSITTSIKLVRAYLPGTGLFFLIAIVVSQGLDMLWSTPATSDWLTAVGIFGHAFISSGVLAASFIYYAKGLEWMQEVNRQVALKQEKPQSAA